MTNKKFKIGSIQFIIIVVFVVLIGAVAYARYSSVLEETTKSLNSKIIDFHFEALQKLDRLFLQDTNGRFVQTVEKDKVLRKNFERMMDLVRISTIQNLFVVTRDANKEYFFLLDSEQNSTKHANIFEPFNPLENAWNKAYESETAQITQHTKSKDLWITIVYPIVEHNKTVALIGADISHQLDINMQGKLEEFTQFFLWVLFLSALFFTLLYFVILYFRRKYYDGYTDPLTQVYNRKYLYDIVVKKLARSYQLFMIDIDFFKNVNDTYGHVAGDAILQEVAKRIASLIRNEDALIRYGGEEFLVYTTNLSVQESFEFAQRIRRKIKDTPIFYEDIVCHITVSIGINPHATRDSGFENMLIAADSALYEAKVSGRDCVKFSK